MPHPPGGPGRGCRTLFRRQSDFALNALAVFVVAVLYVASQHALLPSCRSCAFTGVVIGSVGRCRLAPEPFTPIFPLPALPALRSTFVSPSGVPTLSAYVKPSVPSAFQ